MGKQVKHIIALFSIFLLSRCAQVVPLSGGERDNTPPKLVEAKPENKSLNFKNKEVILSFNEYVQLRDLPNQLLVSPKLKTAPEISSEGKNIVIKVNPEEFLPNTTYRFSFGKAIADMNESNALENFEYIFSTGSRIDSLSVRGLVIDAANTRPNTGVLVGLYVEGSIDSLPYNITPDYISRTDDNGNFQFSNLPPRSYKVIGIADNNKNNLYDGEAEKIGYLKEPLKLNSDSNIKVLLFQEEASRLFIKKTFSPFYGLSQVIFNKSAQVRISALESANQRNISITPAGAENDTVSVYYKIITDSLKLRVQNFTGSKIDTINILLPSADKIKKRLTGVNLNIFNGQLPLNAKIRMSFSHWMDTTRFDLKKIRISSKEDTAIAKSSVSGHWTGITEFELDSKLSEGKNYNVSIDTAAFFSVHGSTNDSIRTSFKTKSKLEFGKVTIKLVLNEKQNYVVQLINEQFIVVKELPVSLSLSSSNATILDFTDVPPGTYQVKIIFDDNKNQKWDTGNFLLNKQPERVIINSKLLKVLADWEIEEEIIEKEVK